MKNQIKNYSKFLSLILRHKPETIGLKLDHQGWADTEELLAKINAAGKTIDFELLQKIVSENDKKRFAFNEDYSKLRASQGHSLQVELAYEPAKPPAILYHGTIAKSLALIQNSGIKKMQRHHVHLSPDTQTANVVATRRGKAIILSVDAERMYAQGHIFYCSENGVWLTDSVPVEFISLKGFSKK